MHPLKIYPIKTDKTYPNLIKTLESEKSLLGSDVDKDGKFYLIVDLDASKLVQDFLKDNPQFAEKVKNGN